MYALARLLLILSVLAWSYCLVLGAVLGGKPTMWALAIAGGLIGLQRGRKQLTTLGQARFADGIDLRSSGMLGADRGLILGRLTTKPKWGQPIRKLFDRRVSAHEACASAWASRDTKHFELVRLPKAIHTAAFCPSGGGKNVSLIFPFLQTNPDSSIVIDFKGENALRTARHREKMFGHHCVLLDPYQVVTKTPDCFNTLSTVAKDGITVIEACNSFANAMIEARRDSKDPHWDMAAIGFLSSTLATVVQYGDPKDSRSIQTALEILASPQRLNTAIQLMCESTCWGGMLARMGGQLLHCVDRERASVLSTLSRHTRIFNSVAVASSTARSTFDPTDLLRGKMTIYLIIPPEHSVPGLLRLWIASLMRVCIQGGLQERNKIHFVLDEASSLGHMDAIEEALDKYRGYGLRLQFYYQSLAQLRKTFPDGADQTLLSNCTQIFMGCNTVQEAEYISARCGDKTIVVDSGGTSTGSSHSWSSGPNSQQSGGSSANSSTNWGLQARRLLKTEEVLSLPSDIAITFAPNVPPIMTKVLKYYQEPWLGKRPGLIRRALAASCSLAASVVLLSFGVGTAALLTNEVRNMPWPEQTRVEHFAPVHPSSHSSNHRR